MYCGGDSEYYTGFIILNLCVVYEIEIFAILLKDREHPSCSSIFCQETENQSFTDNTGNSNHSEPGGNQAVTQH